MRFSPILCLYIVRHFLIDLLGSFGAIMGLIYLFDVIELLRISATHGNAGFGDILVMALFKLPRMTQIVMPFAIMLGSMVCFLSMTRSRELVVMRSAGVSAWQILAPVTAAVLVLGTFAVVGFNPLAAHLYQRFEQMQDKMLLRGNAEGSPLQVGESGLWLRETDNGDHIVVHANAVRQDGYDLKLREVSVFVLDPDDKFRYRIEASLGQLLPGQFHLVSARLFRAEHPVESFPFYDVPTRLTLAKIQDNFAEPETVSFWQLPEFITFFEKSGFSANKQKLYFQSLLASPLLLCAMVLVAAVFTLRPDLRSGGLLARLVAGIATGFVFYFFSRVIYALGLSSTLPVLLAAWTPAVVAGLVGMAALFHLEDG